MVKSSLNKLAFDFIAAKNKKRSVTKAGIQKTVNQGTCLRRWNFMLHWVGMLRYSWEEARHKTTCVHKALTRVEAQWTFLRVPANHGRRTSLRLKRHGHRNHFPNVKRMRPQCGIRPRMQRYSCTSANTSIQPRWPRKLRSSSRYISEFARLPDMTETIYRKGRDKYMWMWVSMCWDMNECERTKLGQEQRAAGLLGVLSQM